MTVPNDHQQDNVRSEYCTTGTSIYQYSIETASESLNDLDLHIIPISPSKEKLQKNVASGSNRSIPAASRAKWIRKRILTENDEIVDQIFDVEKKRICWTSHRPTRGWYQYLRSPMLPPNVRIPLQSPKNVITTAVGSTPLSLTIRSSIRLSQLDQLHSIIQFPTVHHNTQFSESQANTDFTAVNLSENLPINTESSTNSSSAIRTTGVENGSSSQKGHTRRRSAGNSVSHSGKRSVSNPSSTPIVPEEEAFEDTSQASTMVEEQQQEQMKGRENQQNEVRLCTFLLTDDMDFVKQSQSKEQQVSSNPSWARWAWSKLPDLVRPSLRLDGSKSFSIVWLDAPNSSIQPAPALATKQVEILRFEDETGLLKWKERRIGRILIQKDAVQALNLDLGLWIALALAYLEFLEERDGYNASSDG